MAGAGSRVAVYLLPSGKAASLEDSRGGVCGELTAGRIEHCTTYVEVETRHLRSTARILQNYSTVPTCPTAEGP